MFLGQLIGGLARKVGQWAVSKFTPIGEVIGLLKPVLPEVTPHEVLGTLKTVRAAGRFAEKIAQIGFEERIPGRFYVTKDVPWKEPYAYTVELFGNRVDTGQFSRELRTLTFGREMTPGEVIDEAVQYFNPFGSAPLMYVQRAVVTEAYADPGRVPGMQS